MKAFLRDFGIVTLLIASLVFCGWMTACKPGTMHAPGMRVGVSQASLITLMRLRAPQVEPTLDGWGSSVARWYPSCGAFAVKRLGRVQLATAAHCVRDMPSVRYVPPSGVGLDTARVQYISEPRDVAFLDPEGAGLVPLEMAQPPGEGTRVRAFSPVFGQTSLGSVEAYYGGGWYETSQTVQHGWSGSPEVDTAGRAVGVVAKIPAPGHALVASLL